MKPAHTQNTNVNLTHPGAEDLPAERCRFRNPNPPYDEHDGFETVWMPDEGEQRALANGMPIVLRLWGRQHPPVALEVGEIALPEGAQALVNLEHVFRAVGRLYSLLLDVAGNGQVDDQVLHVSAVGDGEDAAAQHTEQLTSLEWLELWERALRETKDT